MGNLVVSADAQLPQTYEHAKTALAECVQLDECKSWADKAQALASYARQANDETLKQHAIKIQRRAEYRMGELLREIEPGQGARDGKRHDGDVTPLNRKQAAEDAGISERQKNDALAIAQIPEEVFEQMVESDDVPTKQEFVDTGRGKSHVRHNSGQNEWYTPPEYIECARAVMGGIDLDPASSEIAQRTVMAAKYYTVDDDGLTLPWRGNVWLNPPYSSDLIPKFCERLARFVSSGDVDQAVLLVNNATETRWFQSIAPIASAMCFPSGRIKYLGADGVTKNTPLQGQCFLYFGHRADSFKNIFSGLGFVVVTNG